MSREDDEWARAAQAGRAATRRKLLRAALVVALGLAKSPPPRYKAARDRLFGR